MDVLEIIKNKRKEKGLTQEQMAKLLNIPRTTYQNIENNFVTLKIYDFFKIIKILNIPLDIFQDEKYIIISEQDFEALKKASDTISSITEKIESNVNVVNHSKIVNMNFNNVESNRKRYCEICGKPSGFYPLCKYHNTLKDIGEVYKDESGHWVEKWKVYKKIDNFLTFLGESISLRVTNYCYLASLSTLRLQRGLLSNP